MTLKGALRINDNNTALSMNATFIFDGATLIINDNNTAPSMTLMDDYINNQ